MSCPKMWKGRHFRPSAGSWHHPLMARFKKVRPVQGDPRSRERHRHYRHGVTVWECAGAWSASGGLEESPLGRSSRGGPNVIRTTRLLSCGSVLTIRQALLGWISDLQQGGSCSSMPSLVWIGKPSAKLTNL